MKYSSNVQRPGLVVIAADPNGKIVFQAPQPAGMLKEARELERAREKERRRCRAMHGK